jgi:signal transduction histidine kinase
MSKTRVTNRRSVVWAADDSQLERQRAKQALGHNFDLEMFSDGTSLLERLSASVPRPDVVVLDWNMPGLSGIEVCRFLRGSPDNHRLPILILTGTHRTTEDIVEALASGANDFLAKPYVDAELQARVNTLVRTRALYDRIERTEQQLRTLLMELPDPLIAVDAQGETVFLNGEATRLFGGATPPPLSSLIPELVSGAAATELAIGDRIYSPSVRSLELTAGVRTHVIALRDVTEALAAVRRRDEFLAMLSHELRNPLAPIVSGLEVLRNSEIGEQQRTRAQEVVERQVGRLCRLVDDLLDVSRVTHGKFELRKQRVDLIGVLQSARESLAPLIAERHHSVESLLPAQPVMVFADPLRLEQIFTNLLGNAARYTPPGGRIALRVETRAGRAIVSVVDNGVGISQEYLPRVFDIFVQADKGLDRSNAGLGIGLTLVKRLTEEHGGDITVSSRGPGLGSEFVLSLPLLDGAQAQAAAAALAEAQQRGLHILLVDDNTEAAGLLAELLTSHGNQVHVLHEGARVLETARALRPDLILLDIGLPGMDGYEVASRIRADAELSEMPLLALTGYGRPEDRKRSEMAGFNAHLVKPLRVSDLRKALASIGHGLA